MEVSADIFIVEILGALQAKLLATMRSVNVGSLDVVYHGNSVHAQANILAKEERQHDGMQDMSNVCGKYWKRGVWGLENGVNPVLDSHGGEHANAGNEARGSGPGRGQDAAHGVRECTFAEFIKCNPTAFHGTEGAVELQRWFEKTESVFGINECAEGKKVRFTATTLQGPALTWWNAKVATMGLETASLSNKFGDFTSFSRALDSGCTLGPSESQSIADGIPKVGKVSQRVSRLRCNQQFSRDSKTMGIRNVPPNRVFGNEVYGSDSEGFGMNPSSNEFRLCNSDEWRSGNHGGRVIIHGYGGGGMVVRHGLKGCLDHRILRSSPILPPFQ
ncbi:hypothetical protein Tco_1102166 [Tanacetum coccineum]